MPTYLYIVELQLLHILYLQKYSTIVQVLYVPLLRFLNCDKKFELLVQEKIVTANDHICTQHPQLNGLSLGGRWSLLLLRGFGWRTRFRRQLRWKRGRST